MAPINAALVDKQRLQAEMVAKQAREHIPVLSEFFYGALAESEPLAMSVFAGLNAERRQSKFKNMLSVLGHLKYFEKKIPALQAMAIRHAGYGVNPQWYRHGKDALMSVLSAHQNLLGVTAAQLAALEAVLGEVVKLFEEASAREDATLHFIAEEPVIEEGRFGSLLDDVGGYEGMMAVHRRFYDVIFDDPWLEQFFYGKSKETLIRKQTEFMVSCLGNEGLYEGDTPAMIHMHMYITDEMFQLRQRMLRDAILAEGHDDIVAQRWLAVDGMFRKGIVKTDVSECVMKCQGQLPVTANKPESYHYPYKTP